MKRSKANPSTDNTKRPRIEETISSSTNISTVLLKTFKETTDEKLRKNIVIQAIETDNLPFFSELLNAYPPGQRHNQPLVNFIAGLAQGQSIILAAASGQKWTFLEEITQILTKTKYSQDTVHAYFLYVALYFKLPLQIIRNLQTQFNIQYIPSILINVKTYKFLELILSDINPQGEPKDPSTIEQFQFLWGLLTPQQKENELSTRAQNINEMLFFIKQGIPYPESVPDGKKFAFLAKTEKYAECSALLDRIANQSPTTIVSNPFEYINILECPIPLLEEALKKCPSLLTETFFERSRNTYFVLSEEEVKILVRVISLVTNPTIKHQYTILLFLGLPKEKDKEKDFSSLFFPLLSDMEILEALASYSAKHSNWFRNDWAKKMISLRPSMQESLGNFMTLLYITREGNCLIGKEPLWYSTIFYWVSLPLSHSMKQFFRTLVATVKQKEATQKETTTKDDKSYVFFRQRYLLDDICKDLRFCNWVTPLLTQATQPIAPPPVSENSAAPITPEEEQLNIWVEKLKKRYGGVILAEKEVTAFVEFNLDNAVYAHLASTIQIDAQKYGIRLEGITEAQRMALLDPMSQDLKTLLRSKLQDPHPGKESYWKEPHFVMSRVLQSLGNVALSHFLAPLIKAIQFEFSAEQQLAITKEMQGICLAYDTKKTDSVEFFINLYKTIANKHPDIQIKEEQSISLSAQGFFSTSSDRRGGMDIDPIILNP